MPNNDAHLCEHRDHATKYAYRGAGGSPNYDQAQSKERAAGCPMQEPNPRATSRHEDANDEEKQHKQQISDHSFTDAFNSHKKGDGHRGGGGGEDDDKPLHAHNYPTVEDDFDTFSQHQNDEHGRERVGEVHDKMHSQHLTADDELDRPRARLQAASIQDKENKAQTKRNIQNREEEKTQKLIQRKFIVCTCRHIHVEYTPRMHEEQQVEQKQPKPKVDKSAERSYLTQEFKPRQFDGEQRKRSLKKGNRRFRKIGGHSEWTMFFRLTLYYQTQKSRPLSRNMETFK